MGEQQTPPATHGGGQTTAVLPADGLLLHVGMPKAASTALQWALAEARSDLSRQGVTYPGPKVNHRSMAKEYFTGTAETQPTDPESWAPLVRTVARASGRVMISTEYLSERSVPPDRARAMIQQLGGSRDVRVLIVMRPVSRVLPSMWQQRLKHGREVRTLDEAVRASLSAPPVTARPDTVAQTWASAVGPENIYVLPLLPQDPGHVMRATEMLLDLRAHTLKSVASNRGFTVETAEMFRLRNVAVEARRRWALPDWDSNARKAFDRRRVGSNEHRIELPGWAWEPVQELQHTLVENLLAGGYQVLGDLEKWDLLCREDDARDRAQPAESRDEMVIPVSAAMEVTMLMLEVGERRAAGQRRRLQLLSRRLRETEAELAASGWRARLQRLRARLPRQ